MMLKLFDRWVENTSPGGLRVSLLIANFLMVAVAWLVAMGLYNLLMSL